MIVKNLESNSTLGMVYRIRQLWTYQKSNMIKKNDILIYSECLEQGDEYALMIALDDEFTPSKVPMVRVQELNTDLPLPPINVFEASY